METTCSQVPGSSSRVSVQSHILRCSALIPDGPPEQCSRIPSTALTIYSSPGILSSTGKGTTSTGLGFPGGRTCLYSSARVSVRFYRYTRAGGKGLLAASMYQLRIRNQASLTRGGVLCKEGLNIAFCLLRTSLSIRAEARTYSSADLPDDPLVPLPERSDSIVYCRPRLIRNPSPPHPLMQGEIGDMSLDI